jgi:cytochrome P450
MNVELRADGRVVCPFDHHSAAFAADHVEIVRQLAEAGPLVWSDNYGGYWIATSYSVVRKIAVNSAAFSVAPGPDRTGGILIPPPPGSDTRPLFLPGEAEGSEHDDYRLALNPHFSKQRVAEMAPLIARHVARAIDRLEQMEKFEVVSDLSLPILAGITCEHLGVDVADPPGFFRAMFQRVIAYSADGENAERIAEDFRDSWEMLSELVKDRRAAPQDDVISHLASWNNPIFSDEQIQMMVLNVVLGAADTTSSLLAQAFLYLQSNPALRDHLTKNPEAIKPAIDEFLRLFPIVMGPARTATRDIEIEGFEIKAGDRVMLLLPAANRDPQKFSSPDEFDLLREEASRHLALGVGKHFCLGTWLAKSIAAQSLGAVLTRLPAFDVCTDDIEWAAHSYPLNHVDRLPALIGNRL